MYHANTNMGFASYPDLETVPLPYGTQTWRMGFGDSGFTSLYTSHRVSSPLQTSPLLFETDRSKVGSTAFKQTKPVGLTHNIARDAKQCET